MIFTTFGDVNCLIFWLFMVRIYRYLNHVHETNALVNNDEKTFMTAVLPCILNRYLGIYSFHKIISLELEMLNGFSDLFYCSCSAACEIKLKNYNAAIHDCDEVRTSVHSSSHFIHSETMQYWSNSWCCAFSFFIYLSYGLPLI